MKKFLRLSKENIEENNEFCEQLIEHCHNKDFLVEFCMQRKEEYNIILQNYEREPTQDGAWELAIAYYGVKSLCDVVTKKYVKFRATIKFFSIY
jgi:hypothetical protein